MNLGGKHGAQGLTLLGSTDAKRYTAATKINRTEASLLLSPRMPDNTKENIEYRDKTLAGGLCSG